MSSLKCAEPECFVVNRIAYASELLFVLCRFKSAFPIMPSHRRDGPIGHKGLVIDQDREWSSTRPPEWAGSHEQTIFALKLRFPAR